MTNGTAILRRQTCLGFSLGTALVAVTVSSCALLPATQPVTLFYPPGVVWRPSSVALEPARGECASQLAADVKRMLSSRGVAVGDAGNPASEPSPEATYVVEITETACGQGKPVRVPGAPGEKEVVAGQNGVLMSYPGRAVAPVGNSVTSGVFMIGATVHVSNVRNGRVVGTLDILRASGGAGGSDGNFMARPPSPTRARSMARSDLESFFFGGIENGELTYYDLAACRPEALPAAPDREDLERALSNANATLQACRALKQSDRLIAEALHNVGVIHLLRNDFVSAEDFLGQAILLDPNRRPIQRAWALARHATRRQAVVLPGRTG